MGAQQAETGWSGRAAGLAVTALMHAAAIYGLATHGTVDAVVTPPVPLMVSFISQPEPPKPLPVVQSKPASTPKPTPVPRPAYKPKPKPAAATRPEAPRLIAAAPSAPEPQTVTMALEPIAPTPASPVVAPRVAEAPPPAAAPARAAPVATPPIFNADYLRNPAPRYPPLARRMGQQGKVVLRVLVNPGGSPAHVEVRSSSGSDLLDEAALDAVRRWRFVPARKGEQPVEAWVLVPITFTLQG